MQTNKKARPTSKDLSSLYSPRIGNTNLTTPKKILILKEGDKGKSQWKHYATITNEAIKKRKEGTAESREILGWRSSTNMDYTLTDTAKRMSLTNYINQQVNEKIASSMMAPMTEQKAPLIAPMIEEEYQQSVADTEQSIIDSMSRIENMHKRRRLPVDEEQKEKTKNEVELQPEPEMIVKTYTPPLINMEKEEEN